MFGDKIPQKRKALTLIEVLVAMSLVGLIIGQCLFMLSSQIKTAALGRKRTDMFLEKQLAWIELRNVFFRLYIVDKECFKLKNKELDLVFDNGRQLKSNEGGVQKAHLYLKNGDLILQLDQSQKKVFSDVLSFDIELYSDTGLWRKEWDSSQEGLPQMIHITLKLSDRLLDQKIMLPFSLKVISKPCNYSPSSFL